MKFKNGNGKSKLQHMRRVGIETREEYIADTI